MSQSWGDSFDAARFMAAYLGELQHKTPSKRHNKIRASSRRQLNNARDLRVVSTHDYVPNKKGEEVRTTMAVVVDRDLKVTATPGSNPPQYTTSGYQGRVPCM